MINFLHYLPALPEKEDAMKCKKCMEELEDGVSVCPSCGESVQAEPAEEVIAPEEDALKLDEMLNHPPVRVTKKVGVVKVILVSVACLALLLSLSVVVWWSVAGVESFDEGVALIKKTLTPRENDVYYKDSYSVSDEKAAAQSDKVVASVGGKELNNGQLQVYYWMDVYDFLNNYGYYAVYMGMDYAQPLDQQTCSETGGTWQQYFLKNALDGWHNYQAMALMAKDEGYALEESLQEELDTLRETLAASAVEGGFSSIDAMLQADMGPGCTYEDYFSYMETYYTGYMYFGEKYDAFEVTDAMIEAYFAEHEETLAESGVTKESGNLTDVRHILVEVEGGTEDKEGNVTHSEDEWEACRAEAQKLLDEWLAGDATEERFAEMAKEHSGDTGSSENGGLYEAVNEDSGFVEEFTEWCMDESRKTGDYGLVKTQYGYHIMYFCDAEPEWLSECRNGVLSDLSAEVLSEATEKYPMTVNYKNIVLGVVDLRAEDQ